MSGRGKQQDDNRRQEGSHATILSKYEQSAFAKRRARLVPALPLRTDDTTSSKKRASQ